MVGLRGIELQLADLRPAIGNGGIGLDEVRAHLGAAGKKHQDAQGADDEAPPPLAPAADRAPVVHVVEKVRPDGELLTNSSIRSRIYPDRE